MRIEATHFIEQYNDLHGRCFFGYSLPLSYLQSNLDYTKTKSALTTVAIFKIKFKDTDRDLF